MSSGLRHPSLSRRGVRSYGATSPTRAFTRSVTGGGRIPGEATAKLQAEAAPLSGFLDDWYCAPVIFVPLLLVASAIVFAMFDVPRMAPSGTLLPMIGGLSLIYGCAGGAGFAARRLSFARSSMRRASFLFWLGVLVLGFIFGRHAISYAAIDLGLYMLAFLTYRTWKGDAAT